MSVTIPINSNSCGNVYISSGIAGGGTATGLTYNGNWATSISHSQGTLKVSGDAEFEGDVKIRGQSLAESLKRIEERLAILVPNVELEADWEELHRLRQQYIELERELLEKQQTFNILKKQ